MEIAKLTARIAALEAAAVSVELSAREMDNLQRKIASLSNKKRRLPRVALSSSKLPPPPPILSRHASTSQFAPWLNAATSQAPPRGGSSPLVEVFFSRARKQTKNERTCVRRA